MRCSFVVATLMVAAACTSAPAPAIDAAFVVAAGDSTFLVEAGARGFEVFRAPILLARLDGRLQELYLVDRDFSFARALFVSQAIYRRDLLSGDSVLVWEDRRIADIATRWQQRHPGEVPLGPDDEMIDDSTTQATSDTELLDAVGPYLNIEFHVDVDVAKEPHEHVAQRRVLDLRTGGIVDVRHLADSVSAGAAVVAGHRLFRMALDSIRRTTDSRAVRAREVVGAFRFDSSSFELADVDSSALVSFFAPGHGASAAGYVLPLGDVPVVPSAWQRDYRDTRPTTFDSTRLEWRDTAWTLVATAREGRSTALLEVVRGTHRLTITELPTPVRRVYRVSASPEGRRWREALRRTFAAWASDALIAPTGRRSQQPPRFPGNT
jgi:hypothetical protein